MYTDVHCFAHNTTRRADRLSEGAVDAMGELLMLAATRYQCEGLALMCEVALCAGLTVTNVSERLLLAEQAGADQLKEECLAFIQPRVAEVQGRPRPNTTTTHARVSVGRLARAQLKMCTAHAMHTVSPSSQLDCARIHHHRPRSLATLPTLATSRHPLQVMQSEGWCEVVERGGGTLVSQVLSLVAGLSSSPGSSPRSPHTDSSSGRSPGSLGSPRAVQSPRPQEAPPRSSPPRSSPPHSSPLRAASLRTVQSPRPPEAPPHSSPPRSSPPRSASPRTLQFLRPPSASPPQASPRSVPPRSGSPRLAAAARRAKLFACDHGCGFMGSHDAVLAHEHTCPAAQPGGGGEGEGERDGEGEGEDDERGRGSAAEAEAGAGAGRQGEEVATATALWPQHAPPASPTRQAQSRAPSTPPPEDRPLSRRSQSSDMVDRINNLSMADLRTELEKRGLPPYGRREALQERLSGAVRQPAGSSMLDLMSS